MTKKLSKSKLRISRKKREVKGFTPMNEVLAEIQKGNSGSKKKESWTIHPSEKQWREDMKKLNPIQRCILIDLRFYARLKDEAWPPIPHIAKNLRVSESTIKRNIPILVKKGFLKITNTSGINNKYKIKISF